VVVRQPRGPRSGIEIDTVVLRQARLDAGMSLADVAGRELTRQAVHLIESGKVRPTARSLSLIASRLGVPEAALLPPPGPDSDQRVIGDLERLTDLQDHVAVRDQARRLIALGGTPERTAFAHHYAGRALYALAQPEEAVVHLREARDRFEGLRNHWWVAESMDWEAIALNMQEDPKALRLGRRALRRYRTLEPRRPETEARILEHLGTICYVRRDYERGRDYYEEALGVEGGVRELTRIARVYHGMAMCHHGLRDLRTARELLFKALTLYEAEQRITPAPMRMDRPRAEADMGLVLMHEGELERAEGFLRDALGHYAAAGIERLQSHTLLTLGELRQRQRRFDEALDFVIEAIDCALSNTEMLTAATGYRQLGELYGARGDHDLADSAFQRAFGMLQEAGMEERVGEVMQAYERVLAERREARRRSRTASA
jgi:tetratricopeptide (TPR) repeat protein